MGLINSTSEILDGSATTLVLPAIATTTGNPIVCGVKWESGTPVLTSVTDTAGNIYTLLTGTTYSAGGAAMRMAYCANPAGHATNVITFNFDAAATFRRGWAVEWNGIATVSALDQEAVASGNSVTPSSGNVTTLNTNDVCFGMAGAFTNQTYSNRLINAVAADATIVTHSDMTSWYRVVTATFTGPAACTQSVADSWGCAIAAFREGLQGNGGIGGYIKETPGVRPRPFAPGIAR
jgi:hypothetical protein